jgi:hypothetical protein
MGLSPQTSSFHHRARDALFLDDFLLRFPYSVAAHRKVELPRLNFFMRALQGIAV